MKYGTLGLLVLIATSTLCRNEYLYCLIQEKNLQRGCVKEEVLKVLIVDNSYNFAFQLHYSISFKSHEFITCIAMSTDTITKQEDNNKKKPPHILLGITGSVAAIKGPELALSLAQSLHAKVIVVLTKGGTNFW